MLLPIIATWDKECVKQQYFLLFCFLFKSISFDKFENGGLQQKSPVSVERVQEIHHKRGTYLGAGISMDV